MRRGATKGTRRLVALVAALTLAACDSGRDAAPVAWVGDWTLTQERLADLLVLAQPLPLDSATVGSLVDQWVSVAALARRAGAGTDLNGPEALEASLWLEKREAVLEAERRVRLGESVQVSQVQARATFQADTLRLLAHVLRRVGAFTSDAERDLQRRKAQAILDGLLSGGAWAEAVSQSEDAETRNSSGLLGLLRIDELHPRLQGVAAKLEPGQVSAVVESPLGYHILYRPRYEDVADLYLRLLTDRLLTARDSAANLEVQDSLGITISEGAAESLRAMARDGEAVPSGPLARWEGGVLEPDVVVLYVASLPGDARARLSRATDAAAVAFLDQLAVRQARYEGAVRAGITADKETLEGMMAMHGNEVENWKEALSDGAPPYSLQAVDRYMERLVARQVPFQSVPPLLRRWLLEPLPWGRDPDAEDGAVATARRLISEASRRPES